MAKLVQQTVVEYDIVLEFENPFPLAKRYSVGDIVHSPVSDDHNMYNFNGILIQFKK